MTRKSLLAVNRETKETTKLAGNSIMTSKVVTNQGRTVCLRLSSCTLGTEGFPNSITSVAREGKFRYQILKSGKTAI